MNGLHRQLERDHLGATFPFLHVRYDPVSDEADLRYLSSRRGFGRFVVGYSSDFVIPSHSGFICIYCSRTFTLTPAIVEDEFFIRKDHGGSFLHFPDLKKDA